MRVWCHVDRAAVQGGDLGGPIPGYGSWLLGHGMSPHWRGRSGSLWRRLSATG